MQTSRHTNRGRQTGGRTDKQREIDIQKNRQKVISLPAFHYRADDGSKQLIVSNVLSGQLPSGRWRPDFITKRQSWKCPNNRYEFGLPMRLQVCLPWPDVATSTTPSGRLVLIGLLAVRWRLATQTPHPAPGHRYQADIVFTQLK